MNSSIKDYNELRNGASPFNFTSKTHHMKSNSRKLYSTSGFRGGRKGGGVKISQPSKIKEEDHSHLSRVL